MIVNENNELTTRKFKAFNKRLNIIEEFSIVGTIYDLGKYDTVVNLRTGKQTKVTRKELKKILIQYNAEAY